MLSVRTVKKTIIAESIYMVTVFLFLAVSNQWCETLVLQIDTFQIPKMIKL